MQPWDWKTTIYDDLCDEDIVLELQMQDWIPDVGLAKEINERGLSARCVEAMQVIERQFQYLPKPEVG